MKSPYQINLIEIVKEFVLKNEKIKYNNTIDKNVESSQKNNFLKKNYFTSLVFLIK